MNILSGQATELLQQKTTLIFEECTNKPDVFFKIVSEDWQDEIIGLWPEYVDSSQVFVLTTDKKVFAGGIVFSKPTPDTFDYFEQAQKWFDKGYRYIGFVFVDPKERNQRLGTIWMNEIINHLKPNPCWLAVDDRKLLDFYTKLGFKVAEEVTSSLGVTEWIMISK